MCKNIKSKLYRDGSLSNYDLEHMRGHPEDLQWLKTHVRPRCWRKFVSVADSRKPRGTPDIEELCFTPIMHDTVLSVLCGGAWDLDSDGEMQMIFYRNGAGEILLRHKFDVRTSISAATKRKSLGLEPPDQIFINSDHADTSQSHQDT